MVVVNCDQGVSRSASAVLAYLVSPFGGGLSLREAWRLLRARRPAGCAMHSPSSRATLLDVRSQTHQRKTARAGWLCRPVVNPNLGFWRQLEQIELRFAEAETSAGGASAGSASAADVEQKAVGTATVAAAAAAAPAGSMGLEAYVLSELQGTWPTATRAAIGAQQVRRAEELRKRQAKVAAAVAHASVAQWATGTVFDALLAYAACA